MQVSRYKHEENLSASNSEISLDPHVYVTCPLKTKWYRMLLPPVY